MPPLLTDKSVTLPVWLVTTILTAVGGWGVSSIVSSYAEDTATVKRLSELDKKLDTGFAQLTGKLDTTNSQITDLIRRVSRNEDDIRDFRKSGTVAK